MALDRSIRVGFRLAEELGKDPEGFAEGKRELRRAFESLNAGRSRPKEILGSGSELKSPDILVLAAEAAVQNQEFGVATKAVQDYFLQTPPQNQYFCRALFAKAQVEARAASKLHGFDLVHQVLRSVSFLLEAVEVAATPDNRPRYDFLLYNASVHYWRIVRPILKAGTRTHATESMMRMVECLQSMDQGCSVEWLINYLVNLTLCFDESNRHDEAVTYIKLAFTKSRENGEVMLREICRIYVWVCRHEANKKQMSEFLATIKSSQSREIQDLVELQRIRVTTDLLGSDVEAFLSELLKREEKVDPDALVMCGRIAISHDLEKLAQQFLDVLDDPDSAGTPSSTVRREYLRVELVIRQNVPHQRSASTSATNGRIARGRGGGDFKMGSRRFNALRIARRIEGIRILERAVASAKRMGPSASQVLHEGCVLAWNIGLPLLQDHLRKHVNKLFSVAALALEEIDSPMKKLRAQLHYEVAKCEVASDFLAKAGNHVSKARALDFGDIFLPQGTDPVTEESKNDILRPLDRYLIPLELKLELKSSLYKEPEKPEERALLLIEQAADARDASPPPPIINEKQSRREIISSWMNIRRCALQ